MQILEKDILACDRDSRIVRIKVLSPEIACKAKPGQFVILMVKENGERVPLTLVESDSKKGTITLIFQEAGYTTRMLGRLQPLERLYSLAGPLGKPAQIKNYGKVIVVGGGVGIAETYPVIAALKDSGCQVHVILGSRAKELLILKEEISRYADKLYIATDDGSLGERGFTSDILKGLLSRESGFSFIYCVGPVAMMKKVSEVSKEHKIKTAVCLSAIMLDGTGMCGTCRITEAGKTRFCCVDGPEFDGHSVDFDELSRRQERFVIKEKTSLEKIG